MNFKCDICGLYIPKKPSFFYLNRKRNTFFPLCSNCEKKIRNQLPSYNDILFNADIREALKNLIFEKKFKIEDFFNLCIISESIILHKNLFTYNPYTVELLNSEFFPKENIFKLFNWDFIYRSDIDIVNHNLWKEQVAELWRREGKDKKILGIVLETACALFAISELFNYSFAPSIKDMRYIEPIIILKGKSKIISNIYNAYSSISKGTKNEIELLKTSGSPIKIFIPPIMSIILDKASSPRDIPQIILEMRSNSEKVRENFRNYEKTIKDENITLKESLAAVHELESINKRLYKSYEKRDIINIKEFLNTLIPKEIWETSKDDIDFKNLRNLISKEFIEALSRRIKNRGVMYLINLKSKFLEITKYGNLIKKIWNYNLTPEDIKKWENYCGKYDKLFL